eukprot:jgi/Picsp_1/3684/NSC_06521-R1_isochorismatase family protein
MMNVDKGSFFSPCVQLRHSRINPETTALLLIDVQNYNCSRQGSIYQSKFCDDKEGFLEEEDEETAYFFNRIEKICLHNWKKLLETFRKHDIDVVYTIIQSLRQDGRDRGLDYKISGFHVAPGSFDSKILEELTAKDNEIIFPKTSSSVFQSTSIDYVLRNLGTKQLVVCGCLTDQCVEHAVRDAADLGYLVILVDDASATMSSMRHENSLSSVAGYCRIAKTKEILDELQ